MSQLKSGHEEIVGRYVNITSNGIEWTIGTYFQSGT